MYNTDDIKNIEAVMAENISTSDYTALDLVHQHMVRIAKKTEAIKQRIEMGGSLIFFNILYIENYEHCP